MAGGLRALLTDPGGRRPQPCDRRPGAIGDRQAVPALIELADKPDTCFDAGNGPGGTIGHSRLAGLSSRFDRKNNELRKASAAAIGRLREPAAVLLDQLAKRKSSLAGGLARAQVHFRPRRPSHLARAGTVSYQGWSPSRGR